MTIHAYRPCPKCGALVTSPTVLLRCPGTIDGEPCGEVPRPVRRVVAR